MTRNAWTGAIARAAAHSPYLAQGLERLPALAALLAGGEGEAALVWAKAAGTGAPLKRSFAVGFVRRRGLEQFHNQPL